MSSTMLKWRKGCRKSASGDTVLNQTSFCAKGSYSEMQTASNIDPEKADTVVQTKNAKNIRPTNSGWGI